jgi:hypothetical protein
MAYSAVRMAYIAIRGEAPSTPAVFSATLVAVTALPFLMALAPDLLPPASATISALALIHVPMTLYLLSDAHIRQMMERHPMRLIAVPVALFAVSIFVYTGLPARHQFWYWLPVAMWQNWYFGKQNVGIYSMFRAAQRAGSMLPVERRMIVAGSILGVLAAYFGAEDGSNVPKDIELLWAPMVLRPVAAGAQFVLLFVSAFYVVRNRARMLSTTAVIFMLSVNFFLPFYLIELSLPNMFSMTLLAHGLQYLTVLGFHARSSKWTLAAYLGIGLLLAEIYSLHLVVPSWVYGPSPLGWGVPMGILLAHFWFDSMIWRFKDQEGRAWMKRRFAFLFD